MEGSPCLKSLWIVPASILFLWASHLSSGKPYRACPEGVNMGVSPLTGMSFGSGLEYARKRLLPILLGFFFFSSFSWPKAPASISCHVTGFKSVRTPGETSLQTLLCHPERMTHVANCLLNWILCCSPGEGKQEEPQLQLHSLLTCLSVTAISVLQLVPAQPIHL